MLVLSRKLNEQIQIGQNITVTILRVKGNTVRVGIEAPRDVRVVRSELPPKADRPLAGEEEDGSSENAGSPLDDAAGSEPAEFGCMARGPVFAALMQLGTHAT